MIGDHFSHGKVFSTRVFSGGLFPVGRGVFSAGRGYFPRSWGFLRGLMSERGYFPRGGGG